MKCCMARLCGPSSTATAVVGDTPQGDRWAGGALGYEPLSLPTLLWSLLLTPLRSPCFPQDEVLELLWNQNHRLQCLHGATGLQAWVSLLDRKEGKGALSRDNSCEQLALLAFETAPSLALHSQVSAFNCLNNCWQMTAQGLTAL